MRDLDDFHWENQHLVAAMRDPDPIVRLRALDLEVEEIDDELAEEMLRLLREDPSEAVRAYVPIALGPTLNVYDDEMNGVYDDLEDDDFPWEGPPEAPISHPVYERMVDTLRRLYFDAATPARVRRKVLQGAVRSPRPWQARAVAAAFRSGDEAWRLTAVFCMGELEGFEDEIVEAFETGSEAVRLEAICAAGSAGVKRLGRRLKHLAESSRGDLEERVAAVEALAELELPGTWDVLEDLSRDFEPAVAKAAEEAVNEAGLRTLYDGFDDDEDDLWCADDPPDYERRKRTLRRPGPWRPTASRPAGSRPAVPYSAPRPAKEAAGPRRSTLTAFPRSRLSRPR